MNALWPTNIRYLASLCYSFQVISDKYFPALPLLTYADEIIAGLKSSPLWRYVEKVQLKVNMCVQILQDPSTETFSKQLLDIGKGKLTTDETGCIKLPTDFCTIVHSLDDFIDQIFPDVYRQYTDQEWLAERAVLAAKMWTSKD